MKSQCKCNEYWIAYFLPHPHQGKKCVDNLTYIQQVDIIFMNPTLSNFKEAVKVLAVVWRESLLEIHSKNISLLRITQ